MECAVAPASLSPAPKVLSFNDPNLPDTGLKAPDRSQMHFITHPQKAKQCWEQQGSPEEPALELQIGIIAIIPVEMLPNWIYRSDMYFCGRTQQKPGICSPLCQVVVLITCNFFKKSNQRKVICRSGRIPCGQQNQQSPGVVQERATSNSKIIFPQKWFHL